MSLKKTFMVGADKAKKFPLGEATQTISAELKLQRISLNYDIDRLTSKYWANISYSENPDNYNNRGMVKNINIEAVSWDSLLQRVTEHFEDVQKEA